MFFYKFIQVLFLTIGFPLYQLVSAASECGGSSIEWFVGHQSFAQITHQAYSFDKSGAWIAVGGTTANAQALLPSAAYDEAAILLLVQANGTILLSSIVTYIFADGTKVNGVTTISLSETSAQDVLGTFSLDSSKDLVFFFWDPTGALTIKIMPTFKTNFGCWPKIDNIQNANAQASFKDCASNTFYAAMFVKTSKSISALNSFKMAVTTTDYSNLFTLSAGGFAD